MIRNEDQILNEHKFISCFDVKRLAIMLFECTSSQLHVFRNVMFAVYRYATSNDYLEDDLITMIDLRNAVTKKLAQISPEFDRIALYQIKLLLKNLNGFIEQLSK